MKRRATLAAHRALALTAALILASCGSESETSDTATGVEAEQAAAAPDAPEEAKIGEDGLPEGTPLDQRVATLGLLNKRNNLTQDIKLKPGEERRIGDVLIKLATCERRPPWDPEPEEGAFVQVFTTDDPEDDNPDWARVFSGWLFLNSPSLNVVEHPIYDVWIKHCAMRFPGEEEAVSKDAKPSGSGA